ncbi:MAG: caspase family protein [Woeseiaceae bacterium]|nr:caspase family protein [Woeseiaceae bacterium]
MTTKHALIIGVDKYCNLDKQYELAGCVSDAKLMKSVLTNYFGFDDARIDELHDDAATREGILAAMDALEKRIDKDDIVVFHFSGHGSRRTAPDPDATDGSGKDSTIMPYDSGRHPKENRDIVDLEINDWLQRLAAKTSNISMTFDCCHSGTVTRDAFADKARSVPDDTRSIEEMGIDVSSLPKIEKASRRSTGGSRWLQLGESYVVMSGCRDNEYSHEFTQETDGDPIRHGALTYFLTNALTRAKPGTTYRDVFEIAHQGVNSKYATQNPQIEGALDRELFGTKTIEPLHFIPVAAVDGDSVTVDGGAAHGLHPGSRWSVYPPGTKETKKTEPTGEIEIDSIGALSSSARLVSGSCEQGSRCVEKSASPDQYLYKVDLSAVPESMRDELTGGIADSELLDIWSSKGSADARVYVLEPRDSATDDDPVPQVGPIETQSWVVIDNAGELAMPIHPTSKPDVVALLLRNFETNARYRNALLLDNPDSSLRVRFNIYRQDENDGWVAANGGDHCFVHGDRIGFEVVNNEEHDVFVSILNFGLDGEVKLLYPPKSTSELIEAGKTLKIGMGNQKLATGVPDEFPRDRGRESLKAFISTNEADFRWLQQQGVRSGGGKSKLRKLFEAAYEGPKTRVGFVDEDEDDDSEDWTATTRSFEVRRK